jgi:CubicO group peptidase (beta-lactamase class C family)
MNSNPLLLVADASSRFGRRAVRSPLTLFSRLMATLNVVCANGVVGIVVLVGMASVSAAQAHADTVDLKRLQPLLERVRSAHKLPALGVAVVTSEGLQSLATVGVRKRGEATPVTNDDLWHLGSDGKAMSATMIARLVERGVLKWEQTLAGTFPELAPKMSADFKAITLSHLLTHRAGINADFDLLKYYERRDLQAARLDAVKDAIAKGVSSAPGKKFEYSNWGYVIASAMVERATGKAFEALLRDELFTPLGMKSVGFGGTGTVGKIDQPWPHTADGKPTPENGPDVDNSPTMAAAGTMHMSLADWGKFVGEHLRGAQGKSALLKKETFIKLQTAVDGDYAYGWGNAKRDWAGGIALTHQGTNTMNHALVWAAPVKDFAVIVVTNQGDAGSAENEVAGEIITAWSKR